MPNKGKGKTKSKKRELVQLKKKTKLTFNLKPLSHLSLTFTLYLKTLHLFIFPLFSTNKTHLTLLITSQSRTKYKKVSICKKKKVYNNFSQEETKNKIVQWSYAFSSFTFFFFLNFFIFLIFLSVSTTRDWEFTNFVQ